MRLEDLHPSPGASRARKRVGRGPGSGRGKTCGRGQKGQKARESIRLGFEGGQMPLQRRLPKLRGVSRSAMPSGMHRKTYAIINVGQLQRFDSGTVVDPETLHDMGIIKKLGAGLRVLGEGKITAALTVRASHFSETARQKIEAAGGKVEVI